MATAASLTRGPFSNHHQHHCRVGLAGASASLQLSSLSPVRLAAASHHRGYGRSDPSGGAAAGSRRGCACSPTTHPGSFRCALHRAAAAQQQSVPAPAGSGGLHDARRSAMANSLVRIAAVEGGDHVGRALAALVRPSSHHERRVAAFRPRPSRLSAMSTAAAGTEDDPSP